MSVQIGNPAFRARHVCWSPFVAAVVACPGPDRRPLRGCDRPDLRLSDRAPTGAADRPPSALIAAIGSLISLRPKSIVDVFLLSFGCVFLARAAALAAFARARPDPLAATAAAAGQIAGTSFVTALSLIVVLLLIRRAARPFVRHSWVGRTDRHARLVARL